MNEIRLPYDIPKSEMSDELKSIGFKTDGFIRKDVEKNIRGIMVLSNNRLNVIKMGDKTLRTNEKVVIIDNCDTVRDISDDVKGQKYVILNMMNPLRYNVGDCYEPYKPKRGDSFMSFTASKGFTEADALFLAIGLSYALGVQFNFYHESVDNPSYTMTFDKKVPTRKWVLDTITKHIQEIEKVNNIKDLSVTRRYLPPFKDVDDFE